MAEIIKMQARKADGDEVVSVGARVLLWSERAWRPAASVLVAGLALLLLWHVVYGRHGLSVWLEKRAEDRALRKQIDALQQENTRLKERIEQLKNNPDAIGVVARDQLHYAKPNEIIVTLPPDSKPTAPSGTTGK